MLLLLLCYCLNTRLLIVLETRGMLNVHTYICMYVYMYIHTYICMYVYMYIHNHQGHGP